MTSLTITITKSSMTATQRHSTTNNNPAELQEDCNNGKHFSSVN